MDQRKIELAHKLRKKAEKLVCNKESLFKYFDSDLGCMCAVAATSLKEIFAMNGFKSYVICGMFRGKYEHCWLEDDNYIYDITATQFSRVKDKVVCLPMGDKKANLWYQRGMHVDSYEFFDNWPAEQQPVQDLVEKLVEI